MLWMGDAFLFINRPLERRILQSSLVRSRRRTAANPITFKLGENTGQGGGRGGGGSPADNCNENGDDDSQEKRNTMVPSSQVIDWRRARQDLVRGFTVLGMLDLLGKA
eukprot:CAMPEP_0197301972 /NCGR_PEP_ID=MMETSP0890-20130614/50750_1 /TAXON_ID=44058 ORGANISM="Aureoumbra lagunensis, Strain CCMP1510" /NCGR_SAMPLE_ID=MMETSP0890 /ASSEMBLY_ACC=CAM_ASM_000533 /LENGTH=107 /DNA_ID=CAMNT_0042781439 /DNA_START=57 /DNA_END=380 /DNA_ORIENTATION=+